jgi:octaprenyl-diphosphate synthase
VDAKQAFPSIAPALQAVEAELSGQARSIMAEWGRDGASAQARRPPPPLAGYTLAGYTLADSTPAAMPDGEARRRSPTAKPDREVGGRSAGGRREVGGRPALQRVVGHVFAARGKLLRPALVLLSAGLAHPQGSTPGGPPLRRALVQLATAVELLHSASLVHDDIIDGEQLRRGQLTLNRRHGDHTAVLVGDLLYARSFALLSSLELPRWERQREIVDLFCRTTQAMCLGEIREQQVLESGSKVGFEEYLAILKNKTAELMSACCRGAAIASDAPAALAEVLAEFGLAFGLAFQLLDDATDRDALVDGTADLRAAAQSSLSRARELLSGLALGPSRAELEAACELVLA